MSEPDPKTGDCSPEPNEASTLENEAVASPETFGPSDESMDDSEEEPFGDSEEESSDCSYDSLDSSESEFHFDASRPKPLGSPEGQCECCKKREASVLCYKCGTGSFCSSWCCEQRIAKGKHDCMPIPDTTAKTLTQGIFVTQLSENIQTLDDYYLTPLTAHHRHEDFNILYSIYRNLVKGFAISSPQLHQWKEAKQIYNNLVRLHNRYPKRASVVHAYWLTRNRRDFYGERDKSEVLDFDAFLQAHDMTLDQFRETFIRYE